MKSKLLLWLTLVLTSGLLGCVTTNHSHSWPVFYDSGPDGGNRLSIPRQPQTVAVYTNGMAGWDYALRIPAARITSTGVQNLGLVEGLRVLEVRLALTDLYYTSSMLILQEVAPGLFLPVYVQNYNRDVSSPSRNIISQRGRKLIVHAGMDYSGTGHFHTDYKITIAPHQEPTVIEMLPKPN